MTPLRRLLPRLVCAVVAATPAGVAHAQSARVTGVVTDSVHRAPLAGATVLATPFQPTRDTLFHAARTDAKGQFAIDGLQAGRYVVSVEHPFTDSIGLTVPPREVQVMVEGTPPLALALPSVATLRRALCRAAESDTTLGVMLGVVRRADRSTVPGANVVFEWTDVTVDRAAAAARRTRLTASARTDSLGVYRACGLPVGVAILTQAQVGADEQSGVIEERIGDASVLVRELVVGAPRRGSADGSAAIIDSMPKGAGVMRGTILTGRARGIAGARVQLFGTSRVAVANTRGEFRFDSLPTGTQGFEVIALGYAPRRFRADVSSDSPPVRVEMVRIAELLDSVRVTAKRQYDVGRYSEFESRLTRGFGQFVTEDDIRRRNPFLVTDLLRMMRGIHISTSSDGSQVLGSNYGVSTLQGALPAREGSRDGAVAMALVSSGGGGGGGGCPQLFIDGVLDSSGDIDHRLVPSAIHGIEVYTQSEVPAKYGAKCGAILVWTK